jgi:2-succinyl-6-hydroxy-2,4-cyclohexadiene-1-carboxylate synthase
MTWAIHGFTGGPTVWNAVEVIPESQCLTVLGHGATSVAVGNESFAGEVIRLSRQLPKRVPHLVGYSLGARLALAIAIQNPTRVKKLSLIGVHPGLQNKVERDHRIDSDRRWVGRLRSEGIKAFVDAWQALPMWNSQRELSQEQQDTQREQRLRHAPLQLAFALERLGTGVMPPMWDDLEALPMPVRLIVGEHDSKFLGIAQAMLPSLSRGDLQIVKGVGHNVVLEDPKAFARLLVGEVPPSRVAL